MNKKIKKKKNKGNSLRKSLVFRLIIINVFILFFLLSLYFNDYEFSLKKGELRSLGLFDNKLSIPEGNYSIFVGENKEFSISGDYDEISWYFNNILKGNESHFNTGSLDKGEYNIKLVVKKGETIETKFWSLNVIDDYEEYPIFETRMVIFYSMIAILVILIFLVIWLFIYEKNKIERF